MHHPINLNSETLMRQPTKSGALPLGNKQLKQVNANILLQISRRISSITINTEEKKKDRILFQ